MLHAYMCLSYIESEMEVESVSMSEGESESETDGRQGMYYYCPCALTELCNTIYLSMESQSHCELHNIGMHNLLALYIYIYT